MKNLGQAMLASFANRITEKHPDLVALTPPWSSLGPLERAVWDEIAADMVGGTADAVRARATAELAAFAATSTSPETDEWLLFGEATEAMRNLRLPYDTPPLH